MSSVTDRLTLERLRETIALLEACTHRSSVVRRADVPCVRWTL
jgi:hypothetical protein